MKKKTGNIFGESFEEICDRIRKWNLMEERNGEGTCENNQEETVKDLVKEQERTANELGRKWD